MNTICIMLITTVFNDGVIDKRYVKDNGKVALFTSKNCASSKEAYDRRAKLLLRNMPEIKSANYKCECE